MAKPTLSLDPYNMELMRRGIGGAPMTRKEAVIASGEGISPSSVPDDPINYVDDLKRFGINLQNILKAGGLSQANLPASSQGIEAAVKKVTEAGGVKKGTPDDFVPFDPTTLPNVKIFESTPGPEGPKLVEDLSNSALGSKVIPSDLAGGRGTVIEKPGDRTKAQRAEDFREKEAALVEMQGGLKSQAIEGQGQNNNPNDDAAVTAFMAGMDEFINKARGAAPNAPSVKSIEDYKEVFAEATGLDISGKPDKSSALMALGLALMQNRAGSGFNVGNILRAVGQAGEKALPELQAARKEAKANAAAAGKYALEMRSSDQAKARAAQEKAMQRGKYYIMPKAEGISGFLSVMDEARPEYLNVTELNALITDPEFSQKYDLITEESFSGLADKVLDSGEAAELFSNTKSDIVLFSGDNVDSMFNFKVNDVNPNLPEGKSPKFAKMSNPGQAEQIYTALGDALQDLNKFEESFAGAIANIDEDGATLQAQATNFLIQAADRLGIEVDANTPTAGLKKFVTKLQAQNAAEILGEAGKTLSDKDRQLVAEIVGDLPGLLSGSPDVLRTKLLELKTQVLDNKRREILRAFQTMDNYSRSSTVELWGDSDWSDDDEKELIKLRKTQGVDS
jgi:predicted RNA-binding protein Jag